MVVRTKRILGKSCITGKVTLRLDLEGETCACSTQRRQVEILNRGREIGKGSILEMVMLHSFIHSFILY